MTNLPEKFRALAASMDKTIEAKLNSGVSRQRPTPRRAQMAEQIEREGRHLQAIQAVLQKLADLHEAGTCPEILKGIKNKTQLDNLIRFTHFSYSPKAKLADAGITTEDEFRQAKDEINRLINESVISPDPAEIEIRRLERDLIGVKIPGFFITPKEVALKLVDLAEIEPGMRVLEPSAGNGSIAEAIRERHPDCDISVIEYNRRLVDILKLKGFSIIAFDFMETHLRESYDRIIMNPPFEKGIDIDHVRHAFECLNPGGRIVAIMSEPWKYGRGA